MSANNNETLTAIEAKINEILKGDAQKNALEFASFLYDNDIMM